MKYPVYIPEITETEKRYVMDCLDSTWISSRGEYIHRFESMISRYTGANHAVALHNGTVALHLALLAYGIGEGDEVIVPDFTYIATANAVRHANATPVLADVDPGTWNVTAGSVEKVLTRKTKAIITTDIYGTPPEMDPILELAARHHLTVIEDAAESLGASCKDRMAGNLGHAATLSFFGNKTITTGEGGMFLTNDPDIAKKAALLKNQGNSETVRYFHDLLGYNYRMTNIQAAIGCAQMERIESILARKRAIQAQYEKLLGDHVVFQHIPPDIRSSYWMVSILVGNRKIRDGLMASLETEGIETRPFFYPVHQMPFYNRANNPVSFDISGRGLCLPSSPLLREEDIQHIASRILYRLI